MNSNHNQSRISNYDPRLAPIRQPSRDLDMTRYVLNEMTGVVMPYNPIAMGTARHLHYTDLKGTTEEVLINPVRAEYLTHASKEEYDDFVADAKRRNPSKSLSSSDQANIAAESIGSPRVFKKDKGE